MAGNGRFTGCDLADITVLGMPWADQNGRMHPVFSQKAALLSFELAATAYDMDLNEWMDAGWRDFSYQVDNTLLTGPNVNRNAAGGIGGAISGYFHHLAQARLKRQNPISQLRGALRQRDGADTCKAVVMLHPAPGSKYVVAIGFMGTGKRIYDWFSNFRLNQEEGMHAGFQQLTKEFEKNCDVISFPETAQELGLPQLTLRDILHECRRPFSRFTIWMAGHSQGGAVMQLFAYRAVEGGVLRRNMIGYGFASPSAAYAHPLCDLESFPLFHILNAWDVFPKMGAFWHIGQCRVAYPDSAMIDSCYQAAWRDPLFRSVCALMRHGVDGGRGMLLILSALYALMDLPADAALTALNGFIGSLVPEKLLGALGSRKEDILQPMIRRVTNAFTLCTCGQEVPMDTLNLLKKRVLALIEQYGPGSVPKAIMKYISLSHKLRGSMPDNGIASYQYIVTQAFPALRTQIWHPPLDGLLPSVYRGVRRLPGGRFAALSEGTNRRRATIQRRSP